ncbi:MAG: acetamidase/formamidase family protein [Bryobacteraceae bacterium]
MRPNRTFSSQSFVIPVFCLAFAGATEGLAETHRVIGESYYHTFSKSHPVLARVKPGDRIVTKIVDSAGFDFQGIRRTKTHGNPLTGAFFIEGAEPGDTLIVRLDRVRLNRDKGYTSYQAGVSNLPAELASEKPRPDAVYKGYDYLRPWDIDLGKNLVRLREPKSGKVRLEFAAMPMLGCIGVAPEGDYSPRSGPAGYWGGNLDYNLIREGNTVMLPVFHPGALLFFGDGHALQGDGEAIGSGVETSLDVEVTVDLRKGGRLTIPRAETPEWIVSIGAKEKGELRETLELATTDMIRWLVTSYGLEPWAAHALVGVQAKYDLASFAGTFALRIPKQNLPKPIR